jgi:hypothetical protein
VRLTGKSGLEAATVCNHKESVRKSKADTRYRPKLSFARNARIRLSKTVADTLFEGVSPVNY